MAASNESPARRKRYERSEAGAQVKTVTPAMLGLLSFLGRCPLLTLRQLAALAGVSEKAARRSMRRLFDTGLVVIVPVTRASLAGPSAANDASLLWGSAENVYQPTGQGLRLLFEAGLVDGTERDRPLPAYGPKNSLHVGHEVEVGGLFVWLNRCQAALGPGAEIAAWKSGTLARADLGRNAPPKTANPDAWFALRLKQGSGDAPPPTLVAFAEIDRGTERGQERWSAKVAAYACLFSGAALKAATGFSNARLLTIAPDATRRDRLARFVAETGPAIADRCWFAERGALTAACLGSPVWRRAGKEGLHPLLPADLLASIRGQAASAGATRFDEPHPP